MLPDPQVIRPALQTGQFIPYFQPLVMLRTGKLIGFEVLARWRHPEIGIISPAKFIPQAEKDGWIGDLTDVVLRQAFAAASPPPLPITLSVNAPPACDFSGTRNRRTLLGNLLTDRWKGQHC